MPERDIVSTRAMPMARIPSAATAKRCPSRESTHSKRLRQSGRVALAALAMPAQAAPSASAIAMIIQPAKWL
jgi:hypothetical protein